MPVRPVRHVLAGLLCNRGGGLIGLCVCVVSVWCVDRCVDGRSERYPRRRMSALYIALVSCAAVDNALVVVLRALVLAPGRR